MPSSPRRAFETIDLLRALAAVAVVWNHAFTLTFGPAVAARGPLWHALAISGSFGREAVLAFFVISGFWISKSCMRAIRQDRWSWRAYLVDRLSRLWVVLLPALLIGGGLDALGREVMAPAIYARFQPLGSAPFDVATRLGPLAFLGNLAFLQDMLVPTFGTNGPLWSLACEFWYYVWFPALALLALGRRRWPVAAGIAATALTVVLSRQVTLLFGCWLLGALVAAGDARLSRPGPRLRPLLLAGGALAALAGEALARDPRLGYFGGAYAFALGFALLLLALLRCEAGPPRALRPVARYGAESSFSLYALHLPVLVFILAAGDAAADMLTVRAPTLKNLLACALLAFFLVGLGRLFSLATEANTPRLRDLARRLLGPAEPAADGRAVLGG